MNNKRIRLERHIIIGMIVSDEYIRHIRSLWLEDLFLSSTAKTIANWAINYFDKYNESPKEEIQSIFQDKYDKDQLSDEEAEDIEDILESLSDEFERGKFNVQYLIDRTKPYFLERHLEIHEKKIKELRKNGDLEEANKLAAEYSPPVEKVSNTIDLADKDIDDEIRDAFNEDNQPLFELPGPLGEMMNEFMTRDSFVALLAPEKRGKTWWLMKLALYASRYGCNAAVFQAGDMSKHQFLRRVMINKAKKSDKEKYVGKQWIPVKDCIRNQLDTCDLDDRECDFGIFSKGEIEDPRKEITKSLLIKKANEYPDYNPCHNCDLFSSHKLGTPWLVEKDLGGPLTAEEAVKVNEKHFKKRKRRFKIDTYPTKTLTIKQIKSKLKEWERNDGFIPDVIIIDYADILATKTGEFRHGQNDLWMDLRALSQEKHVLLLSATQADAKSYSKDTMNMDNFSEDKRKLAHVTGMFGINQDAKGREKEIGITRINKIVVREGELIPSEQVYVLQSIKQGEPILTSYW